MSTQTLLRANGDAIHLVLCKRCVWGGEGGRGGGEAMKVYQLNFSTSYDQSTNNNSKLPEWHIVNLLTIRVYLS